MLKANYLLIAERPWIQAEIRRFAARFSIKLHGFTVSPDHVHFVISIPSRRDYIAFIRALSSRIAKRLGRGVWKEIPFTRVAQWGRDFRNLLAYLRRNEEEARVERAYKPRKDFYRIFRMNRSAPT